MTKELDKRSGTLAVLIRSIELVPLKAPRVNLNGTSAESLLDQVMKILDALRDLENAFAQANPHARDFQGSTSIMHAYQQATDAWDQRRTILLAMRKELEAYGMAIGDQRK